MPQLIMYNCFWHITMNTLALKNLTILAVLLNFSFGDVLVTLPNGVVRGKEATTLINKPYSAFEGIPYATPPLGNLRFQPPLPPQNWEGILNATSLTKICYQSRQTIDLENEDCLYINVFSPNVDNVTLIPVIVFIYGGGFIDGAATVEKYGPQLLLDEDLVVVTFNYRVGPFGFLSTQDQVIPGNAGLKDQLLALKWIKKNIEFFGGDPEKVTIYGESAGAASVAYLLLNKETKGLFRAGICSSGTALNPWSFQRYARKYAFETARVINSSFDNANNSQELLNYLLSLPASQLNYASSLVMAQEGPRHIQVVQGSFYAPVLETEHQGAFITEKMYGSFLNGNFQHVSIIIGINSEESLQQAEDFNNFKNLLKIFDNEPELLVPDDMLIVDQKERAEVGKIIKKLYVGKSSLQYYPGLAIRFFSDTSFNRGILKHAEFQSKFTDVYLYQFSYDGKLGNLDLTVDGAEKVAHGEDLNYVWTVNEPYFNTTDLSKFPTLDIVTLHRLLTLFTNFAKTLNPTPEDSLWHNIVWPTMVSSNDSTYQYLDISSSDVIKANLKMDTLNAWDVIYNNLSYNDFDTY